MLIPQKMCVLVVARIHALPAYEPTDAVFMAYAPVPFQGEG